MHSHPRVRIHMRLHTRVCMHMHSHPRVCMHTRLNCVHTAHAPKWRACTHAHLRPRCMHAPGRAGHRHGKNGDGHQALPRATPQLAGRQPAPDPALLLHQHVSACTSYLCLHMVCVCGFVFWYAHTVRTCTRSLYWSIYSVFFVLAHMKQRSPHAVLLLHQQCICLCVSCAQINAYYQLLNAYYQLVFTSVILRSIAIHATPKFKTSSF